MFKYFYLINPFWFCDHASAAGGYQCQVVYSRCSGAWDGVGGSGDCAIPYVWGTYTAGTPAYLGLDGGIFGGPGTARRDDGFSARCVLALK